MSRRVDRLVGRLAALHANKAGRLQQHELRTRISFLKQLELVHRLDSTKQCRRMMMQLFLRGAELANQ